MSSNFDKFVKYTDDRTQNITLNIIADIITETKGELILIINKPRINLNASEPNFSN